MLAFDIAFEHVQPPFLTGCDGDLWTTSQCFATGQRVQISAASGRGKSTAIRLLYGMLNDYSGSLMLDGQEQRSVTAKQWAQWRQRQLAVVFQDLRLFPRLTARENIELKNRLTGHFSNEVLLDLAERLRVDDVLDQPCGVISLGQQQRVAILRALAQPFTWLLLDEPFSHLDIDSKTAAAAVITEQCNQQSAGYIWTCLDPDNSLETDIEVTV